MPGTNFVVPGANNIQSDTFVAALVGVTEACNVLVSSNCAFQIFPGSTFLWNSTNGMVIFTPTPGMSATSVSPTTASDSIQGRNAKDPDNFPVNPVDLTGPELANSIISVDQFLALANLTPESLAAMGGGISIFSASLIPSEAAALAVALSPDAIPPTTTATPSPGPNANGWNNTNVTVAFHSVDNPGGSGVKQITIYVERSTNGFNWGTRRHRISGNRRPRNHDRYLLRHR
jgi:hypothetical protein